MRVRLDVATDVDTSKFAKAWFNLLKIRFWFWYQQIKKRPSGLGSLNSNVDQIDVDKLVAVPVDLSKLSDVVKMMSIKMLNKLN